MSLTAAQITTLTTDVAANSNTVSWDGGAAVAINAITTQQKNADSALAVAAWYNQLTASFFGNYTGVPLSLVKNFIKWKNFLPIDAPDTTQLWLNRATLCQAMQFNIQTLLGTGSSLDATQKAIVQGLNDSLTACPSGSSGASRDVGWATPAGGPNVQTSLCRLATNAEKLFADTSSANGSTNLLAATLTFQGSITGDDILHSVWGM